MHFYIGGAYQGKLDAARKQFDIAESDVFTCAEDSVEIDFGKRCVYHTEKFVLACVRGGVEAADYFKAHRAEWENSVIICNDIFCGVVPTDAELRAWREMTGRLSIYLTNEAESVTRVFCGLGQKLK